MVPKRQNGHLFLVGRFPPSTLLVRVPLSLASSVALHHTFFLFLRSCLSVACQTSGSGLAITKTASWQQLLQYQE